MQKLTELVFGLIVILAVSKQGFTKVFNGVDPNAPIVAFLEPVDFKTKSCPDGLVMDLDYFIVTGYVNVTNFHKPKENGLTILLYYTSVGRLTYISGSYLPLWNETCRNEPEVPKNRCRCLSIDDKLLRIKCNFTAHQQFSRTRLQLLYSYSNFHTSEDSEPFPYVYSNSSCSKRVIQSKNQGSSLVGGSSAISGIAIICIALFLAVSSLFSYG